VFVLDASIILAWCFTDEAPDDADQALGKLDHEDAVAPAIWPLEVANALRMAERRGRLDLADLTRVRDLLTALPVQIETVALGAALGDISEFARRLDLSAYDAAYLELAARRGLPLATIDDRLKRACAEAGVELVA